MQVFELVKRNSEVSVESISSGFVVTLGGITEIDEWRVNKIFVQDLNAVKEELLKYYKLPLN